MEMTPEDFDPLIENARQAVNKFREAKSAAILGLEIWEEKLTRYRRLQFDASGKHCGHAVTSSLINSDGQREDFCSDCYRFIGDYWKGDLF